MSPPRDQGKDRFLTPVVKDDDGRKIARTMRRTDALRDLTDFYYAMVPTVPRGKGVFLYRGKVIDGERTPADCKMGDGDQVDFFLEMKPSMFITLKLYKPDGPKLTRTVRRTDPLKDLMDYYYTMQPKAMESRFMFECTRIRGDQTPMDLKMEDGDELYVLEAVPPRPRQR
ncbi:hypothetical protein ACP70R_004610 [Stipagrostis hirtigluma subsp. patula]